MNKLDLARKEIDKIDKELVKLFEKRMKIVKDIAHFKYENNLEIFDESREDKIIEKNSLNINNLEISKHYQTFLRNLFTISKTYQKSLIRNKDSNNK